MIKQDLINLMKTGEKPKMIGFFSSKENPNTTGPFVLSNFYKAPFSLPLQNGEMFMFTCVEQYMMYAKAMHFGDFQTAQQILDLGDVYPLEYKKLGRKVKGFNDSEWTAFSSGYVRQGLVAKFTQNEALRRYILSTNDAVLVEDSPYDKIWGCGVSATDPRFKDPSKWSGVNRLGFLLMDVRKQIKIKSM